MQRPSRRGRGIDAVLSVRVRVNREGVLVRIAGWPGRMWSWLVLCVVEGDVCDIHG